MKKLSNVGIIMAGRKLGKVNITHALLEYKIRQGELFQPTPEQVIRQQIRNRRIKEGIRL